MSSNTSSSNLDLKREADLKMLTNGHSGHGRHHDHPPPRFLQIDIKQEDKFFSRLLSKEDISSKGNDKSSFRVMYYGGATGTVPFMWESQPGTPKHTLSDTSLPPLTPPPSYQFSPKMNSVQKCTKPRIFHSIFPKIGSKKTSISPLCSSSSVSSCLSSKSLPSMNVPFTSRRKCIPRSRSAIYLGLDEEDDNEQQQCGNSPTSTLCFGARNGSHGRARVHYPVKNLRKAFLSIVGHGNA